MPDDLLIALSEDLISLPPLIFRLVRKKVTDTLIPDTELNITPLQIEILILLEKEKTLHISEIGNRLHIAKAQMTKLVERLEVLKFIKRKVSTTDRRVINVSITKQAEARLKADQNNIMRAIQKSLQSLSHEDQETVFYSLRNLRMTLLKLE
jgi:DNA-binding MarR family transcriptional regulator